MCPLFYGPSQRQPALSRLLLWDSVDRRTHITARSTPHTATALLLKSLFSLFFRLSSSWIIPQVTLSFYNWSTKFKSHSLFYLHCYFIEKDVEEQNLCFSFLEIKIVLLFQMFIYFSWLRMCMKIYAQQDLKYLERCIWFRIPVSSICWFPWRRAYFGNALFEHSHIY